MWAFFPVFFKLFFEICLGMFSSYLAFSTSSKTASYEIETYEIFPFSLLRAPDHHHCLFYLFVSNFSISGYWENISSCFFYERVNSAIQRSLSSKTWLCVSQLLARIAPSVDDDDTVRTFNQDSGSEINSVYSMGSHFTSYNPPPYSVVWWIRRVHENLMFFLRNLFFSRKNEEKRLKFLGIIV